MEKFLEAIRVLFWGVVILAIVFCFIGGMDKLERGGGALAGGALVSATLILVFTGKKAA